MSAALVTIILAAGLAIVVVRRRSFAIALLAVQSLALGVGALEPAGDRSGEAVVAGVVLLTKAIVIPALLLLVVRRTREARLVVPVASAGARLACAGVLALAAVALVPPLGLGDPRIEQGAVALVLIGIAIVVARRQVVFQLVGLVVAENGLSLLAVSAPGGMPYVIELGALFDLALIVTVAAAFARRIHGAIGTGDTELLRSLRD